MISRDEYKRLQSIVNNTEALLKPIYHQSSGIPGELYHIHSIHFNFYNYFQRERHVADPNPSQHLVRSTLITLLDRLKILKQNTAKSIPNHKQEIIDFLLAECSLSESLKKELFHNNLYDFMSALIVVYEDEFNVYLESGEYSYRSQRAVVKVLHVGKLLQTSFTKRELQLYHKIELLYDDLTNTKNLYPDLINKLKDLRTSCYKILQSSGNSRTEFVRTFVRDSEEENFLIYLKNIFQKPEESIVTMSTTFKNGWLECIIEILEEDFLFKDIGELFTRHIEFPPHLKQAGLSALGYFSEIVSEKFPDQEIKIRIEQSGDNSIALSIYSNDGSLLEKIERTYNDYGLVLSGKMPVESFISNEMSQIKLSNKIDLLQLEIRQQQRFIELQNSTIQDQTKMLSFLMTNNKQNQALLKDLIKSDNKEIMKLVEKIDRLIVKDVIDDENQQDLLIYLAEIKKNDPTIFNGISDLAKGALSGALGRYLYVLFEAGRNIFS